MWFSYEQDRFIIPFINSISLCWSLLHLRLLLQVICIFIYFPFNIVFIALYLIVSWILIPLPVNSINLITHTRTSLLAEYSSSLPALLLAEISIDFNWSKQSEYSSHSQSTQSTLSNKLCHKPIKPSHCSLQNVLIIIWLNYFKMSFFKLLLTSLHNNNSVFFASYKYRDGKLILFPVLTGLW